MDNARIVVLILKHGTTESFGVRGKTDAEAMVALRARVATMVTP